MRVFLGGDGEGMAEGEVHGRGVARGQVSTSLGSFKDGGDDLLEDDTETAVGGVEEVTGRP